MGDRRLWKAWGGKRANSGRKQVMEDPVSFTAELERPELEALKAIAKDRSVSAGSLVREAVRRFLARQNRS